MILDNGILYVVSGATLTALRARDGTQLWQFQGAASRSTPLVADGTVYVASTTAISAVRSSDGKLIWNYTLNTANIPPLALENHVLYVGSTSLTFALQTSDGKPLWTAEQPAFSLTVMDGEVFTYSFTTAAALRSSDGKLLWSFDLHTTRGADNSTSTPTASGIVYINTFDTLYALQAMDGKQLWSAPANGDMKPVIVNNVLYTLSTDNHPSALKADDGTILWKSPSIAYAAVANADDGAIYAGGSIDSGSQTATAFALKMSDGSRLWGVSDASGKPRLIESGVVYFAQCTHQLRHAAHS
jgi:outer membrane protein assembly factor BamB